ncbi:hypothetical protein ACTXT7_007244 [Hymenolepis weldensis]
MNIKAMISDLWTTKLSATITILPCNNKSSIKYFVIFYLSGRIPASTDGHFAGTDFDSRSYLCVRSGLLKVPTAKHHPNSNTNSNLSIPFGGQEASRCASATGMYANSSFNNSNNNLHTRHASGSAAYLRSHVMLAPPNDGTNNGGGGIGSYLSDSDLNSNIHHTGSVSSSPGLRTKSISPTTSSAAALQQHDVLFAHSRPQHQMIPHLQAPNQQLPPTHPGLLFCQPNTTTSSSSDFLPMNTSDADMPLRLSRSPAMNYSASGGSGGGVDGQSTNSPWGGNQQQQRNTGSGSVLPPVLDDYSSSSPLYLSTMRGDNIGDGSGNNDPSSVQNCGGATSSSFQSRCGGVQQQRRCIPGTMSGLGASGFPPRTDLPLVDNFNNFATVDSVNSLTGSLNPNSNSPSLTIPQKRPRRH